MFAVSTQCNDTQHIFVVNYSYFFAKFIVAVLKNWLQFVFSPLLLQFSCVGFQNFAFIFFTFALFTYNFYLLIYLLYVFAFIALQYAWSTTLALCIAQSKATCNHIVAVTTATSSWQLSPFTRNNNSRVGGEKQRIIIMKMSAQTTAAIATNNANELQHAFRWRADNKIALLHNSHSASTK